MSFTWIGSPGLSLGLWDAPYKFQVPKPEAYKSLTAQEPADVRRDDLPARLSSIQYDQMLEAARTRANFWRTSDVDVEEVHRTICEEVTQRRDAWIAARDAGTLGEDGLVLDLYLCWGARILVMLAEEWEVRRSGLEQYVTAFEDRSLPWQKARKQMMLQCN